MANNNYHFTDNGSPTPGANNVGIGTNCSPLNAKLVVVNPFNNFGVDVTTSRIVSNNIGIRGSAINATSQSYGVYGMANSATPVFNTGVYGEASTAIQTNYGGRFRAFSGSSSNIAVQADGAGALSSNYGIIANAQGGSQAMGVRGQAFLGTVSNYGVYGTAAPSTGGGLPNDSYAGFFNGDVFIVGGVYPSDATI